MATWLPNLPGCYQIIDDVRMATNTRCFINDYVIAVYVYTYAAWVYIYIYIYEYVCIIYALATLSFELKFFISKSLLSCTVLGMIAEWKVDEWNNEIINEWMNEVEGLNINWVILMTYNALIIVDWSGGYLSSCVLLPLYFSLFQFEHYFLSFEKTLLTSSDHLVFPSWKSASSTHLNYWFISLTRTQQLC